MKEYSESDIRDLLIRIKEEDFTNELYREIYDVIHYLQLYYTDCVDKDWERLGNF